jgi:hypothetical protein
VRGYSAWRRLDRLDPTSGLLAGEGHIPLACTPQPTRAPVEGLIDECEVAFEHDGGHPHARIAARDQAYTETQWTPRTLGAQVDRALTAGDVRLTQGGEPTFVSIDDRDGAEWNTDALGPTKRAATRGAGAALRAEYATAASCISGRASGIRASSCRAGRCRSSGAPTPPVWHDPSLFADEREPHARPTTRSASSTHWPRASA